MQTTTRQKRKIKRAESNVKKDELVENEEKNRKNEELKKNKLRELQESTKNIRKLLSYSIDPYDTILMWWESKHVRYAISYPPVKLRLEKLMKSHVVRLTDYKYMQKLAASILNDHIEQQRIRIEKRKLAPPSIIKRLLEISYKALTERIKENKRNKLKLYM